MKNLKLVFILGIVFCFACAKKPEKPQLTLGEYSAQAATSKGAVEKILQETDYKKMHEIALAIESSRAIKCITVTDECNVLGKILNLIVKSTNEGLPSEADNMAIYKLVDQLDKEYEKGHEKLALEWKNYINANASEVIPE